MTTVSCFPTVHLSKEIGSMFLVYIQVYIPSWYIYIHLHTPDGSYWVPPKHLFSRLNKAMNSSQHPLTGQAAGVCDHRGRLVLNLSALFLLGVRRRGAKLDTVLQMQSGNIWNKWQLKENKAVFITTRVNYWLVFSLFFTSTRSFPVELRPNQSVVLQKGYQSWKQALACALVELPKIPTGPL